MRRPKTASLILVVFVIGWLAARPSGAEETPAPSAAAGPETLRIVTYNVQFLPGIAAIANKRKEPLYRAKAIGEKLAAFDIVGLNEVFERRPREMLLAGLGAAWGDSYHDLVSPQPPDGRFNGGLAIATRRPLVETHTLTYTQGSSPKKYGVLADGFAAKGALHARIARDAESAERAANGKPNGCVDVFITHLEARADEIRETQYPELADFIRQHAAPDCPAIVMGDFNTHGDAEDRAKDDAPYHRMKKLFDDARAGAPFVDLWPKLHDSHGGTTNQEDVERGSRIDMIFLSNPAAGGGLVLTAIRVNPYLDEKVGALSDHSAVEAELRWPAAAK
ncbi:MAG: endonuclease/exonuclease/phosphatase family protein [Pirellulales bacterium]|nr:endonuclease/exonuclease/phosphatase family protein [Pirellulales bacterium]